jgi:isocitrate dehydrogenase
LGIKNSDDKDDKVKIDEEYDIMKKNVGIKCEKIKKDEDRVEELKIKKMWLSKNGKIRKIMGGKVLREKII